MKPSYSFLLWYLTTEIGHRSGDPCGRPGGDKPRRYNPLPDLKIKIHWVDKKRPGRGVFYSVPHPLN
jgi:hypothetical protein